MCLKRFFIKTCTKFRTKIFKKYFIKCNYETHDHSFVSVRIKKEYKIIELKNLHSSKIEIITIPENSKL